jgi:hypothetical protein
VTTERLDATLDDLRRRWVPDSRLGVFEVRLEGKQLTGVTTHRSALEAVRRVAGEAGLGTAVTLLPDGSIGDGTAAVTTAAAAPLLRDPEPTAIRRSEALHGERLTVLQRRGGWLRVCAADGYHGWIHEGYVATGPDYWADDWSERATEWSLGAELRFEDGRLRIPVGGRVAVRRDGQIQAADGRIGDHVAGVLRPALEAGAEARLLAPPEWALRWLGGAPYCWGGRCEWGIDCSGFTQTTYAVRGIALPRDADLQYATGREIPFADDGGGYCAGDLLFFAEHGRVSHVAMWSGAGTIVHASLAHGGIASDDLFGDHLPARRLRAALVGVRRPA